MAEVLPNTSGPPENGQLDRNIMLGRVFRPTAPIDDLTFIAGRKAQQRALVDAITQTGRHAVMFGERGVGKTSLANTTGALLRRVAADSIFVSKVICDGTDTFDSVWRKFFDEIPVPQKTNLAGFEQSSTTTAKPLSATLSSDQLTPSQVAKLLQGFRLPLVVFIDEFDRLPVEATTKFADTIKILSDQAAFVTLVLVGVADSVDRLIADHASVERAVSQIRMPRMTDDELQEIIETGLKSVGMTIEDAARERIIALSQGLPHYTHLLSLHSARHACDEDSLLVREVDVRAGIAQAVNEVQQSIITAHANAIRSARAENLYPKVALACALATNDMLGYFQAADVIEPLSLIMGKEYNVPAFARHLYDFCEDKRGPMLTRMGESRFFRYRFINTLLQPYLILDGLKRGLITEQQLETVRPLRSSTQLRLKGT